MCPPEETLGSPTSRWGSLHPSLPPLKAQPEQGNTGNSSAPYPPSQCHHAREQLCQLNQLLRSRTLFLPSISNSCFPVALSSRRQRFVVPVPRSPPGRCRCCSSPPSRTGCHIPPEIVKKRSQTLGRSWNCGTVLLSGPGSSGRPRKFA